jgi:hypothetical protein
MVDLDAPRSQGFLEIPVGLSAPQVPPNGYQDDLRREPESSTGRAGKVNRASSRRCFVPVASVQFEPAYQSLTASAR